MERAIVFFLAIIFLASILYLYPTTEGFECGSMAALENKLVADTDKNTENRAVNPELAQAGFGTIEPSPAPPTDLPIARIEERAKGDHLPYRDHSSEPAKYIRLNGMLQDLQAFMAFQSQSLADQCEPNIQLPLTTARADLTRLQNSISVLNRNPGMQSKITNQQVRGMQDNLNYLKDEIRNLENSGAIKESFVGGPSQDDTKTPATLARDRKSVV